MITLDAQSSSVVYELVRSRIMAGHYPPGAHLTEGQLCDELEVSRSPVRAALRRLGEEGLIQTEPHRGAFVAQWTRSDVDEVFELRRILESRGAGLAAERRTSDESLELRKSVEAMVAIAEAKKRSYKDDLHHNNREFHLLVLSAARSPRLYKITEQLAYTSVTLGTYFYYSDTDIARSIQFHRDITDAIAQQNSTVADALMSAHIGVGHVVFDMGRFGDDDSPDRPRADQRPTHPR